MKTGSRQQALGNSKAKVFAFVLCALIFALSVSAEAEQPKKVPRIGFLVTPSRVFSSARIEAFRQGLHDLGYIEGKNIAIEYRYAEGKLDRLPQLAAELVGVKVDVIVTTSGQAVLAAKNATRSIPIVFAAIQDPVAAGIVDSLAKPGGNETGLSIIAPELGGKRLELLKETVPGISRIAFLWNSGVQAVPASVKETQAAARATGLQLQLLEVRDSKDFDGVFKAARKERAQGLLTNPGPVVNSHQARIVEFAAKNRIPAMYSAPEFVDVGGLMSYAPSPSDQFRHAAVFVDKILKGAKPGDLPVEQPTKFELVINLKTAKQLGLTIPQSVLYRADRVIK